MWFIDSSRHIVVTLETRSDGQKKCEERQQPESVAEAGCGNRSCNLPDLPRCEAVLACRGVHHLLRLSEFEVPAEL